MAISDYTKKRYLELLEKKGGSNQDLTKSSAVRELFPDLHKELITKGKSELRSKGQAVSIKSTRVAPTLGGEMVRGMVKPIATLLARPYQATLAMADARKPLDAPERNQVIKSRYLGDIGTSQKAMDVLRDVGRGLETVSWGIGSTALAKGLGSKGVATAMTAAAEQTAKEASKKVARAIATSMAKQGALTGFVGSAGRTLTETEGKIGKDLLNVGIGTGVGALAGYGLGLVGGKFQANKYVKALEENKVAAAAMKEAKSVESFVQKEVEHTVSGVKTTEATKGVNLAEGVASPGKKISISADVLKKDIENMVKVDPRLASDSLNPRGTLSDWSQEVRDIYKSFPEEAIRVGLNGEKTIQNNVPKSAYTAVMMNIAAEEGNVDLSLRLMRASSIQGRIGGQEMVARKIADHKDVVGDIMKAEETLMKNKGLSPQKIKEATEKELINISDFAQKITNQKMSRGKTLELLKSIIC